MKALSCPQHFLHFMCVGNFFQHSRASNSKVNVGSGKNLNLSEILCLFWFPASLMEIQSKLKALSYPRHFLHYKSMGKFFVAQGNLSNLAENRIHLRFNAFPLNKVKYGVFRHSRESNSKENNLIWPELKFLWDFSHVLVTCKFNEDLIKTEGAINQTFSSNKSMGKNVLSIKGK